MKLKNNLKQIRLAKKISLENACLLTDISYTTLWRYENSITTITVINLIKLLQLYNVSFYDVFEVKESVNG